MNRTIFEMSEYDDFEITKVDYDIRLRPEVTRTTNSEYEKKLLYKICRGSSSEIEFRRVVHIELTSYLEGMETDIIESNEKK